MLGVRREEPKARIGVFPASVASNPRLCRYCVKTLESRGCGASDSAIFVFFLGQVFLIYFPQVSDFWPKLGNFWAFSLSD